MTGFAFLWVVGFKTGQGDNLGPIQIYLIASLVTNLRQFVEAKLPLLVRATSLATPETRSAVRQIGRERLFSSGLTKNSSASHQSGTGRN
jgi:hypothetical protein